MEDHEKMIEQLPSEDILTSDSLCFVVFTPLSAIAKKKVVASTNNTAKVLVTVKSLLQFVSVKNIAIIISH